jgi:hypothetical protein
LPKLVSSDGQVLPLQRQSITAFPHFFTDGNPLKAVISPSQMKNEPFGVGLLRFKSLLCKPLLLVWFLRVFERRTKQLSA